MAQQFIKRIGFLFSRLPAPLATLLVLTTLAACSVFERAPEPEPEPEPEIIEIQQVEEPVGQIEVFTVPADDGQTQQWQEIPSDAMVPEIDQQNDQQNDQSEDQIPEGQSPDQLSPGHQSLDQQAPASKTGEAKKAAAAATPITLGKPFMQQGDFRVTAAEKDPSHPFYGQGHPIGFVVNGVQGKELVLTRGKHYTFVVDTGMQHDFYFSTSKVGWGGATVTDGIKGQFTYDGEVVFVPEPTTPGIVYYQCRNHKQMGGKIHVINEGETVELAKVGVSNAAPADSVSTMLSKQQVKQKIMLADMMLASSSVAKRISTGSNEQAKTVLEQANSRLNVSKKALDAGDTQQSLAAVEEVFVLVNRMKGMSPQGDGGAESKERYEKLSAEVQSFAKSYNNQISRVKNKKGDEASLDNKEFQRLIDQAAARAEAGQYQQAAKDLTEAKKMITTALTALMDSETVVYDINFATPAEEFDYELGRFRSYEELVPVAIEKKKPTETAIGMMNDFVEKGRAIRDKAKAYAESGDYDTAMLAIKDATMHVQRALRIAGVQ